MRTRQGVPVPGSGRPRPAAGEALAVAAGLSALVLAQILLADASGVFARYLWVDEYVTYLIVSDSSMAHSLRALAAGVDSPLPPCI